MFKTVIAIKYPGPRGEHIAMSDARKCMRALRKRFPELLIEEGTSIDRGTFFIAVEGTNTGNLVREVTAFAEGFMASAELWER